MAVDINIIDIEIIAHNQLVIIAGIDYSFVIGDFHQVGYFLENNSFILRFIFIEHEVKQEISIKIAAAQGMVADFFRYARILPDRYDILRSVTYRICGIVPKILRAVPALYKLQFLAARQLQNYKIGLHKQGIYYAYIKIITPY